MNTAHEKLLDALSPKSDRVGDMNKFEWWLNGLLITSLWPILFLARLTYYSVRKIASK